MGKQAAGRDRGEISLAQPLRAKKREDELRKSRPYIEHASGYLNRAGAEEAVRDGWYELLRNWALGAALKEALGCPAFVQSTC